MATLTGTRPQNTYQGLLKMLDSDTLEASLQQVSDGFGNTSPLFISFSQVAILGASGGRAVFNAALLDADRTFHFQNQSGTIATLEDCINSITGVSGDIQLVGDTGAIGPRQFYGTNGSSVRGFYTINTILSFWQEGSTVFSSQTINTWSAIGSPTNISAVILPKGTGSFALAIADGTNIGGNVRGNFAVDLQRTRSVNTQVASGNDSFVATRNATASGFGSAAFNGGIASGNDAFAAAAGIASGSSSASFGGTSSGQRSFTANAFNNVASATDSSSFGNQGNISGERSFGVGHFARSSVKNALVIGGSVASNITSMVIAQYSWKLFGAVAATPYTLVNAQGENLILDFAGAASQTRVLKLTIIAADDSTPKGSWVREILITLDVGGTTHNIVDTQVLHSFENNSLVGATIGFSVINGNPGQLVMTFTPSTSASHAVRCFAQWFGCFAPAS